MNIFQSKIFFKTFVCIFVTESAKNIEEYRNYNMAIFNSINMNDQ